MRLRHWQLLMEVTGVHLAVGTDAFKLHHLLEAGLLEKAEEIEEIANSAVKELQIEEKLRATADGWSDEQLSFANFKARGPLCLKGSETAELMEKMEEALMGLGSMTASRYIGPFKDEVTYPSPTCSSWCAADECRSKPRQAYRSHIPVTK